MKLDVSRLHELALNGKRYRGQGSTTLACDTCINQALLGCHELIFCEVKSLADARRIIRMMVSLLTEEGIDYLLRSGSGEMKVGSAWIKPYLLGSNENRLRGLDCLIVDFVDY